MKIILMVQCVIIGMCFASTTIQNVTKTESDPSIFDIESSNKSEEEDDSESTDLQKKRESGYSYSKPMRLPLNYRPTQFSRFGYRRRPHSKRPAQQNRPFSHYGLPNKNPPLSSTVMQQNHLSANGFASQDIPSPIRNVDFEEPDPIASQNNVPFGSNTALYLPPKNQRLPMYTSPSIFSMEQRQNLIQDNSQQISDAALFLAQNAQAISQLYGAPASNQIYAPSSNEENFFDKNNQIQQQNEAENIGDSQSNDHAQVSQGILGPLPGYASGILSNQETLQTIQSLEKDRLILQLQQALLQSQNRYSSQNNHVYDQNQHILSTVPQFQPGKVPDHLGPGGNTFNYGLSPLPTTTSSTIPVVIRPSDGKQPVGSTNPTAGSQQPSTPGFTTYGGFVPTIVPESNVPSYNPSFIGFGSQNIPLKPVDNPTHFGIPFPPTLKPVGIPTPTVPNDVPSIKPSPSVPVFPVHSITPTVQPVRPVYPISTPLRPIVPVNPVTPIHPVITPLLPQGPLLGSQPGTFNPGIYKHLKGVYPFYFPSTMSGHKQLHPWTLQQKEIWT